MDFSFSEESHVGHPVSQAVTGGPPATKLSIACKNQGVRYSPSSAFLRKVEEIVYLKGEKILKSGYKPVSTGDLAEKVPKLKWNQEPTEKTRVSSTASKTESSSTQGFRTIDRSPRETHSSRKPTSFKDNEKGSGQDKAHAKVDSTPPTAFSSPHCHEKMTLVFHANLKFHSSTKPTSSSARSKNCVSDLKNRWNRSQLNLLNLERAKEYGLHSMKSMHCIKPNNTNTIKKTAAGSEQAKTLAAAKTRCKSSSHRPITSTGFQ